MTRDFLIGCGIVLLGVGLWDCIGLGVSAAVIGVIFLLMGVFGNEQRSKE